MPTLGEYLVHCLEAYGVTHVFGIPGVHTVEMYRGLAASPIAHVTPRHEQGAGFMADGYARATGRPGVAFVITGPGLTNILTAMAQAHADSVPMLVVSAVNRTAVLGLGDGDLHEIEDQRGLSAHATAFSHRLTDPAQLAPVLARAFAVFEGERPRPVHIEIPLDLFAAPAPEAPLRRPAPVPRPAPSPDAAARAAAVLSRAERPVILAGGGAARAGAGVRALAEALGAPVVMTTNARGVLADHPLAVPASPSLRAVRALLSESDAVLVVGSELGQTDCDMYELGPLVLPSPLVRIDIDAERLCRRADPTHPLPGDAAEGCAALLAALDREAPASGAERAAATLHSAYEEIGEGYRKTVTFLDLIRDTLPDAPIVGDSTQAAYAGNLYYAAPAPARWFNAATGYGALGYGLPAAIGAALGAGGPVVCIAGDGGLQFSLAELGCAVEQRLPLILLVWDNKGYGEIKRYMLDHGIEPVGVDLHTPDFEGLARAYGAEAGRLTDLGALPGLLHAAAGRSGPTVIVFDEAVVTG